MRRETTRPPLTSTSKSLAVMLAIGLLLVASLNLFALPIYPPPSCDDVSYTSTAVSFLERGQFGWSPVFTQGDYIGRDVNWTPQGRLFTSGLIAWYWVLGVSRYVGRAYGLLGGLFAALLLYWAGSRFYSRRVGLWAALLFATSNVVFLSSHLIRPDIWLSAFNLLALLVVHKSLNSSTLRWTFLAGLVSALAFDIHGNGIATIAAAVVTVGFEYGWRQRRIVNCVIFAGGLALGLLYWVVVHLWPDPVSAFTQISDIFNHTSLSGPTPAAPTIVKTIFTIGQFIIDVYGWQGKPWVIVEALLSLCGLIVALKRRNRTDQFLLSWVAVSFFIFGLIFSQRFISYNSLFSPLLILLGVSTLEPLTNWLAGALKRPQSSPALATWVSLGVLAINLAGITWLTFRYANNNFDALSAALEKIVPPGSSVLADPNWWWALRHEHTFITDEYFLYPLPPFEPDSPNVTAAVNYMKPDYVLVDLATSCFDVDGPGHAELVTYVEASCTLVSKLDGVWQNEPSLKTTLLGQTTSIYQCIYP